jgi:class 3 adenylate cyclase/ABC-type branched-subunit amino acid transport system substrate-binding protein
MAIEHGGTITRGFMFADLRGYTDYVEQRGAVAAAELLTRYRMLARQEIGRFGGAEIKTEGDSFYVVFDSVSSAVRCGLAITAAARDAADEPIRVGIGIHAGETIEADGGFVGSPVNIAARICAQASAGEVWVSETVRALTMTLLPVRFRSRGRRQLKGIADPIELFAVDEAAQAATAWPSSGRRRRLSRRARVGLVGAVAIVLAAAAAGGWLASRPSTGLPSGPFTIGVHVPLSGTGASYGIAIRNAVQLAVDQRSADGALADMDIRVKAFDTGNGDAELLESPARSAAAVSKMASDERTLAAVGPFNSPSAERTIPITNRAGLLECSPSNSNPALTKPDKGALELRKARPDRINYVRLSPSSDVLGRALASFATHDLNAESALVMTGPASADLAPDFITAFTALGGQVATARLRIIDVPTRRGRSNAELARLFDAGRVADARKLMGKAAPPDVVVVAGGTEDARAVRKAMRDLGRGSTPLLSWDTILDGSGVDDSSYLQRTGKDAVGTYAGLTSFAPHTAAFVDAYRARFGEEPTDYASAAYACTQIILASLEASAKDGPSADGLREAVRTHAVDPTNRYDTVLGTLGFDENGDSTQQVISFYRVDPEGANGAGDWALIKQQDFGPQPS